uniref:MPN domain-containing protein n=1 Tax=Clastoptera arizonana TaxID=38151 RepID=A0A1B6C1U2_9HEMI
MAEVRFTARAYCKMILHATKYPHCAINGVLLAESSKSTDSKKTKDVVFVDAIPLFHLCLHVSPMAEIALTQIDQMANSEGLMIAGYYLANENIRDLSIDKPATRIADKIAETFSSACLVLIDNQRLSLTMVEPALQVSQFVDVKWKVIDKSSWAIDDETLDTTSALIERHTYESLVDFDNHLDNISLDWRNTSINWLLEQITSQGKE